MYTLADALLLYVSTLKKLKDKADANVVSQAAMSDDKVYVNGLPYDFDIAADKKFVNGDSVYVAFSDDESKVVILG